MVDCKECSEYVHSLLSRGDITKDDIDRIILDRHMLKGCDKKTDHFLEWINFAIQNQHDMKNEHHNLPFPEWNKGYLEALLDARIKYNAGILSYESAVQ